MNITTPCHGEQLIILTVHDNSESYYGQDVPDEIICNAKGCYNSWNADGTKA